MKKKKNVKDEKIYIILLGYHLATIDNSINTLGLQCAQENDFMSINKSDGISSSLIDPSKINVISILFNQFVFFFCLFLKQSYKISKKMIK